MFCASLSSTPQLIAGERRPIPRKLSAVSPRIMPGIASVAEAMMWLRKDGIRWRNMTRGPRAPSMRAASTKSSSRSDSSLPRTTRAMPVQPVRERMTVIRKNVRVCGQSCGIAALSAIHNGSDGIAMRTSMMRWITMSARPPK